jgi:hypothetical protein
MFHDVQQWNRENIPGYREIYLQVPLEELQRRDAKGIYAAARRGDLRDVVGLDVAAELPKAPDLTLDNFGALDISAAVDRIWIECVMRDTSRGGLGVGALRFGWRLDSVLPGSCRKSVSQWPTGASAAAECLPKSPRSRGVLERSSSAAAHKARMVRRVPRRGATTRYWVWSVLQISFRPSSR